MHSPQPDDENNRYVKTILILAANPAGTSKLQLDKLISCTCPLELAFQWTGARERIRLSLSKKEHNINCGNIV
ncbi:MAG: hypothetical protein PUP93_05145 [Rhizonema sp. NSF051]|nr:hypothetical protein [Rhizonema sp. NSF051]